MSICSSPFNPMLTIWWRLIAVLVLIYLPAPNNSQNQEIKFPRCSANHNVMIRRPRITVVTHNSLLHSVERAMRDAAAVVGAEINCDMDHMESDTAMASGIRDAADRGDDGLIVTISNNKVCEAVQYARDKNVPVIVFNTGMSCAIKLGLTRVLQSDADAGTLLASELVANNYSRPLVILISSSTEIKLDINILASRIRPIENVFGTTTELLVIHNRNSTSQAIQEIKRIFMNGNFDSIIYLGGAINTDIITGAVLGIRASRTPRPVGFGFFDMGMSNMTRIMSDGGDSWGISQLPYAQAVLPVFLLHLEYASGFSPYTNRTIPTGPVLVTKENYNDFLLEIKFGTSASKDYVKKRGAMIPNTRGSTSQISVLADTYDFAKRLNWNIFLLPGSDQAFVRETSNVEGTVVNNKLLPVTLLGNFFDDLLAISHTYTNENASTSGVNTIHVDINRLAKDMARSLIASNSVSPVCFSVYSYYKSSEFCDALYDWYKAMAPNTTTVPVKNLVSHSQNLTSLSAMEAEFHVLNRSLFASGYRPDVYVTVSEQMFDATNYPILKGLMNNDTAVCATGPTFDQTQTFLKGRVDRIWNMNLYVLDYLGLLDIALSRSFKYQPWRTALVDTPPVKPMCEPGTYYVELASTAFCYHEPSDTTIRSIQCLPCDADTFNPFANSPRCMPCPAGTFSAAGASNCTLCDIYSSGLNGNNSHCTAYARQKSDQSKKKYLAIFLPIGLVLVVIFFAICLCYLQRWYKRNPANNASDTVWLLSYSKLMSPSLQHLSSQASPSVSVVIPPSVSPASIPLLAGQLNLDNEEYILPNTTRTLSTPCDSSRDDNGTNGIPVPRNRTTTNAGTIPAGSSTESMETRKRNEQREVGSDNYASSSRHLHHLGSATIDDYFSAIPIEKPSSILYCPGKQPNRQLTRSIGFHRNLPVFVKQIGFRRLHVDAVMQHEISLMKMARHPKLVEFIGLCIEPQATYIVEEYCSKGSLYDALNNPDISLTWIFRFSLINDLLDGLGFLQRSKFMYHGCLNSKCCLITGRWELKITDYDLSKVRQSQYDPLIMSALAKKYPQMSNRFLAHRRREWDEDTDANGSSSWTFLNSKHNDGSSGNNFEEVRPHPAMRIVYDEEKLLWLAPESVMRTHHGIWITYPGKRADVYSAGIIINEIVSRKRPFREQVEMTNMAYDKVFKKIQGEEILPEFEPPDADEYTCKVNDAISQCLKRDPNLRPSVAMLKSRIKAIDPHLSGSDSVVDNLAILLEQYANDMENLVRQRTANLQQRTLELEEERARTQNLLKDLNRAKEAAEAAAASKQNFLANMSHEIRTPMNAVIGMSRILMESNLPGDLYDCAETIESSGNHLMAIIDDILDYAKIDSGKLNLEHRRMNLTYVVESALKLVSPNFSGKGITLWYSVDPDIETAVYGDVVRLRQVLLNLLSNALKFTPKGYVAVRIHRQVAPTTIDTYWCDGSEYEDSDTEGAPNRSVQAIEISVQDTGVGIRADKADKLFQTFSQVDASTTRNFGGTGLGLAISRRLCRMMGGDLWFESEFGRGSTFFCRILLQMQGRGQTYAVQNRLDQLVELCPFAYVVSDHVDARDGLRALLKNALIPRVEVASFQEAENYLSKQQNSDMGAWPSVLIISEDHQVIKPINADPTNSQAALDGLRAQVPYVASIPALLIRDAWSLRRERNRSSPPAPQLALLASITSTCMDKPSPTTEKRDPFEHQQPSECRVGVIAMPMKNSKLFSTLIELLSDPDDTLRDTTTTVLEEQQYQPDSLAPDHPDRAHENTLGRITSTRSSISSAIPPLAEIASNSRTLLVDDNLVNQKVVTRMLSRFGIQADVAENGKEACRKIEACKAEGRPIDLVFMDIWMPEMNGYEAAIYVRSKLADSPVHPYIIAMTACVMTGDREKCIAAGMNGYVSKPVRKDDLEASIHTYTQVVMRGLDAAASDHSSIDHTRDSIRSVSDCSSVDHGENSPSHPLVQSATVTSDDT